MPASRSLCVAVASKNPVKAASIEGAMHQMLPDVSIEIRSYATSSGVPDQPVGDNETRRGALNRLTNLRQLAPEGDVWAALEGGIEDTDFGMFGFAWIIVETRETRGQSRTATFPIPHAVADLVRSGVELGHANDQYYKLENSKQKGGAIGILTDGLIDRRKLYEHAAIMAFVPLRNELLGSD